MLGRGLAGQKPMRADLYPFSAKAPAVGCVGAGLPAKRPLDGVLSLPAPSLASQLLQEADA